MDVLTYDRAVELAREVVAEFGDDYVYPEDHKELEFNGSTPSCVYVHDDKPSCVVGQILHRHGVSIDQLMLNEFRNARVVAFQLAGADDKARFFLSEIQSHQDKGHPWGESLTYGITQTAMYH